MKKIFLITMIHFDNLEKTQIRARDSQIIGFAETRREARDHVAMYADPDRQYLGWDGRRYPIYEIAEVNSIKAKAKISAKDLS